jgi:hypothetical protein
MVCVGEVTYRLERLDNGQYEVIRLSDEVCAGRFGIEGKVRLLPQAVDAMVLRRIAREAIQLGKTPPPPMVAPKEPESAEEPAPLTPRRGLAPA